MMISSNLGWSVVILALSEAFAEHQRSAPRLSGTGANKN